MKKTRFIPYGYTMRDGRTVIQHEEADVIRHIFSSYISGASLKEISEELTRLKVPYTEKTDVWDKARIARIIDNSRYIGSEEYDPIIDEEVFEEAVAAKTARQRNQLIKDSEAIALLRDHVKCGKCGCPMVRRINSKCKTQESWTCVNDECGFRVRISDTELLTKVNLLMNRLITNTDLLIPKKRQRKPDSPIVAAIQKEVDEELEREQPSETFIISKVSDIASQLYAESNAKAMVTAQIAKKRALLMKPEETFSCGNFSDLIDTVILDNGGKVTLETKTQTSISEGDPEDGSNENTQEKSNPYRAEEVDYR